MLAASLPTLLEQVEQVLCVKRKPCNKPVAVPLDPETIGTPVLLPYQGIRSCCFLDSARAFRLQCSGGCKLWFPMTEACFAVRKCNTAKHKTPATVCPGKRWGECLNCNRAQALAHNNKQSDERKKELNRNSAECQKRKRLENVDAAIQDRIRLQKSSFERRNRLNALQRLFATQCDLQVGQCARCRVVVGQVGLQYNHLNDPEKGEKVQILCKIKHPKAYWIELQKCEQLCVPCHIKFTHDQTGCGVEVQENHESKRKISAAKAGGCVCCGAKPDAHVGLRNFVLDHILNTNKAEWYKKVGGFVTGHPLFNHAELDAEILKCQTLCFLCSQLKTYLEHPQGHTMQKHQEVRELHAGVWNWYKERYKNDAEMVRYLTEGRGITLEFLPIVSVEPVKSRKVQRESSASASSGSMDEEDAQISSDDEEASDDDD